jgi:hypothetical protein
MRSVSTGETMDESPYQPSLLPGGESDDIEPDWWLTLRRFGLTMIEWIVLAVIAVVLVSLLQPAANPHKNRKPKSTKPAAGPNAYRYLQTASRGKRDGFPLLPRGSMGHRSRLDASKSKN